ncbi:aspartate/glutamate racemase family protein [Desertibaculum subflavum]|uniref:aspartate/glutamate racemase family protein n=1 Tax=Desertibaculum subflavum TaxID=2268458 RepID=UPI000E667509
MRLLLINPNTTPAITDRVLAVARAAASPGVRLAAVTGRFGGRYIADRATYAIAGHAALDALASYPGRYDAVVLACFGDPGLLALKEVCPRPVVGMAEASLALAITLGRRVALVTGGEAWVPMLEEFVAAQGLSHRLAAVLAVAPTGADIARDPEGSLALLAEAVSDAVQRCGADVVVLGGAGLAGLAAPLAARVAVPVLDSVVCAIRMAEAVAGQPRGHRPGHRGGVKSTETVGLSAPLRDFLRRR